MARARPRGRGGAPGAARGRFRDVRARHSVPNGGAESDALLAAVSDAHTEVVKALNPRFREEREVAALRAQGRALKGALAEAQRTARESEARLAQALAPLRASTARLQSLPLNAAPVEGGRPAGAGAGAPGAPLLEPELFAVTRGPINQAAAAPSASASAAAAAAAPKAAAARKKAAWAKKAGAQGGIKNVLKLPPGLRDHWFPVEFSAALEPGGLLAFELFEERWVVFRDAAGDPACLRDELRVPGVELARGLVGGGRVAAPGGGWAFNRAGECEVSGLQVRALDTREHDACIWVWAGDGEPEYEIPDVTRKPDPMTGDREFHIHAEISLDVPVEHGLLIENLLDLAHAPFTHTETFAKGWSVPDLVNFKQRTLLGGNWEPYPIDMSFEPPCLTLSTIGLAQPGKVEANLRAGECEKHLHQLHVSLPSSPGRTRLLYRMSLDFISWAQHVPFIDRMWVEMANKVLGEDLVLVKGQQDRLERGGDVWANPVAYDKLGVRYRRWRNAVDTGDKDEKRKAEAAIKRELSSGELFSEEGAPEFSPTNGRACRKPVPLAEQPYGIVREER